MKKTFCLLAVLVTAIPCLFSQTSNTLTPKEKKEGWILIFDGTNTSQWKCANDKPFSASGWEVKNGALGLKPVSGSSNYIDIVTQDEYSDFDLMADFKTSVGANSGIKYFYTKYEKGGFLGFEYQVLDDDVNEDAKEGHDGNRRCGSFYDMLPASAGKKLNAVGKWNTARIISKDKHVEHWLNGVKILEFERGSKLFMDALKQSKFNNTIPVFGEVPKGRILLQYHGSEVWFKNIKVRILN
jgi:hypothetical protein